MYNPIQPGKIYEQVAAQIEQRILSGELRAGDRLPTERDLSTQFRVSRTAVREAMKTLEQKGLIAMRPGRGIIVIDGTSQALRHSLDLMLRVGQGNYLNDLTDVREILEPEIAARAAQRATEEQIAALQRAVEFMDEALDQADAYIAADDDFHRTLAEGTQNALILALVDSIMGLLSTQRTHIFSTDGGPQRGQIYHKQLLDAIRRHDPDAARQRMRAHLQQVREDVERAGTL